MLLVVQGRSVILLCLYLEVACDGRSVVSDSVSSPAGSSVQGILQAGILASTSHQILLYHPGFLSDLLFPWQGVVVGIRYNDYPESTWL